MNAPRDPDEILSAWLDEGPTRLPDQTRRAIVAGLPTVIQRWRLSWVPWRLPIMSAPLRLAAAIAVVALVGYTALNFLSPVVGPGSAPPPSPTATPVPTSAATPVASEVAPGIPAWAIYSSAIYPRLDVVYPADWSVRARATRAWQIGDQFPADTLPYADTFVSPGVGDAQIGLIVWEMPHAGGGGPDSFELLKEWAETFCNDVLASCEGFTKDAIPMCHLLGDGCDAGDGAILVPTAGQQYAFFRTWQSELFDSTTVRVVIIPREDSFPPAAQYGGSVALLKAILAKMDVWAPGQTPGS